jgi:hypothetical protein
MNTVMSPGVLENARIDPLSESAFQKGVPCKWSEYIVSDSRMNWGRRARKQSWYTRICVHRLSKTRLRFDIEISRMWSRSANHYAATFDTEMCVKQA